MASLHRGMRGKKKSTGKGEIKKLRRKKFLQNDEGGPKKRLNREKGNVVKNNSFGRG